MQNEDRSGKMDEEIVDHKQSDEKNDGIEEKANENKEKLSFFQCKQDLILRQFIEILKSLES